jgi:DNA-binding MarR family transcriptional regulator
MISDEGRPESQPLSVEEEEFVRALARVVIYIPRVFEADLGRAEGFSTSEFFALMHLSESPGGRLRMGDLAARSALSLGAVTRVVKVLESKGLVERRPSPSDGRGYEAVLTEPGCSRLGQVRPAQVASVRRRVFDKLAGIDLQACTDLLSRISQDD